MLADWHKAKCIVAMMVDWHIALSNWLLVDWKLKVYMQWWLTDILFWYRYDDGWVTAWFVESCARRLKTEYWCNHGWLTYCFVEYFVGWQKTKFIDAILVDLHKADFINAVMTSWHFALLNGLLVA